MPYQGTASITSPPTLEATFEGWPSWNGKTRLDISWNYKTGEVRKSVSRKST